MGVTIETIHAPGGGSPPPVGAWASVKEVEYSEIIG